MGRCQVNETNGDPTVYQVKDFQEKNEELHSRNLVCIPSHNANSNAFPGDLTFRPGPQVLVTGSVVRTSTSTALQLSLPLHPFPLLQVELVNQRLFHQAFFFQGKKERPIHLLHGRLPPLRFLPVNSDGIICYAINLRQSDYTGNWCGQLAVRKRLSAMYMFTFPAIRPSFFTARRRKKKRLLQ